jgi:plasmid replication initiation protein
VLDRPSPHAARQRRYRARQRRGVLMVTVGLPADETAILRRLNCLTSDSELEDRAATASALAIVNRPQQSPADICKARWPDDRLAAFLTRAASAACAARPKRASERVAGRMNGFWRARPSAPSSSFAFAT